MKTLLIIDANSLIHRSYHALPPLTDISGAPAGALYGLSSALIKIFKEINPDYAAAAYDRPEPTFRKKEFAEYKAHRPPAENDLISQIIASKDFFEAFKVKWFECPGFEADDIVGTLAERFENNQEIDKIIILSGDLDTLQLVKDGRTVVLFPRKGLSDIIEFNEEAVIERYGIPPVKLTDYKGLVGDTSDNIPGVSGVGPKTAAALIKDYGNLEDLYELSPFPKTETLKRILASKEIALLSKKLATIDRAAPIGPVSLSELSTSDLSADALSDFLTSKGFKNLSERINRFGLRP